MSRRRKRLILVAAGLTLLVCGYDRSRVVRWVGATDLEVRFVVTDAASGEPVPGARVEVMIETGFPDDRGGKGFVLIAGPDGIARKEFRDWMRAGSESRLRLTDTYSVRPPDWLFRVVADRYAPGDWVLYGDLPKPARATRRLGPGRDELVVSVSLARG